MSGALLFAANATTVAANPAFRGKLALIAIALLNVAFFHRRTFRSVAAWDRNASPSRAAKIAAVVSLLAWTAVVAAGRMIAYL